MKAVDYYQNADGTWTARIFSASFTGTYEQCIAWIQANGERA
jgi:hypothetical protein